MTELKLQRYNKMNTINEAYKERIAEISSLKELKPLYKVLKDVLNDNYYVERQPDKQLYGKDYYIDAKKSVEWNIKEREKLNKERLEFNKKQRTIVQDTHNKFKEDLVKVIVPLYNITEEEAMVTVKYADSKKLRLGDVTQVGVIIRTIDLLNYLVDYTATWNEEDVENLDEEDFVDVVEVDSTNESGDK